MLTEEVVNLHVRVLTKEVVNLHVAVTEEVVNLQVAAYEIVHLCAGFVCGVSVVHRLGTHPRTMIFNQ